MIGQPPPYDKRPPWAGLKRRSPDIPVKVAILTDIHSNLPAFEAVLSAIDEAEIERRWCLGDVVGYGAQPDDCTRLVSERCELSLVGNHDLAVTGEISTEVFSASAAAAVEWTRAKSDASTIEFLKTQKPENTEHEVSLYHASPRDPVWEYVLAVDQARECIEEQASRVSFIAGCSTRAAWASLATAIREQPGSSWTRTSGRRPTTASPTTSTRRRRRSGRLDCPNCSPTASMWANDPARSCEGWRFRRPG